MDGPAVVNPSIVSKSNLRRNILIVSVLLLILASGVIAFLLTQNKQNKTQSTVSLTKEYSNPFDTKTQYVNPFSDYKNPFDNLVR